jgi:hypothetical protein
MFSRPSADAIMINKSTDAEVRALIQALAAGGEARREAAIARLIIIGRRAVGRLVSEYHASTDRALQRAILRVLEAAADERCLGPAQHALQAGGELAVSAVGVVRELLAHGTGRLQADALDCLLLVTADPASEHRVRAAAVEALRSAPDDVRTAVSARLPPGGPADEALWADAIEGHLPDDPDALREAVASRAPDAPLPILRRLVEAVRESERQRAGNTREGWRRLRGALHQAIAARRSRVGLDDLRESFETAIEPLPSPFLAAVQMIGDDSCLESIATAYSRSPLHEQRWRQQLVQAFESVRKRERLTLRHPAMRRAVAKMRSGRPLSATSPGGAPAPPALLTDERER